MAVHRPVSEGVLALRAVAVKDPLLAGLVFESEGGNGGCRSEPNSTCPTPFDLLAHMRRARGRQPREEAAHVIRVLLREIDEDPFLGRMLVQALVPGLITVAGKLQWGVGGEWRDGEEFFGELLSTAWEVVARWAGQDRPYAVLDLLSAIRCRLRRQLLKGKESSTRDRPLEPVAHDRPAATETDLEELARLLMKLHSEGMHRDEVQVLYAEHVLGYSVAELATVMGRDPAPCSTAVATEASAASSHQPGDAGGMTRAYRVPVAGGGRLPSEALRARLARGRPNWWVILAVSLALMALLVETTGSRSPMAAPQVHSLVQTSSHHSTPTTSSTVPRGTDPNATTTLPPTSVPAKSTTTTVAAVSTPLLSLHSQTTTTSPAPSPATTTSAPPAATTTTTTTAAASLPADRTQAEGYLTPPTQTSNSYDFTGSGAMEISVVWSVDTYLTMTVTCTQGEGQSVGGTMAMGASLPDAGGTCQATVTEPSTENTTLTYTITMGPAGA